MHMKTIFGPKLWLVMVAFITMTSGAFAAQVLTPVRVGGSNSGADISTQAAPLPAGTTLFFDVNYSVTGNQTANEAGLGLKVQYDASKFDPVITYDGTGNVTSTLVSNLLTKCMIANPSDQLISGNNREVVFGWIDTSIRGTTSPTGAVGWPGLADPASPGAQYGCLNPGGIVSTSSGVALPTTLFRIGLRSKSTFDGTAGQTTSNIVLTTAGNISYANSGNVDTNKTIVVNAQAAPSIVMTGALSRLNHGATAGDRDVPVATAYGSATTGTSVAAVTSAASAGDTSITVEPRRGTGASFNNFAPVMSFNVSVTSGAASIVSCLQWNGASAVACATPPSVGATTFSGTEATIALNGVPDQSRVRLRLANVNGSGVDAEVTLGFLVGDIQNDRATNTGDINQVKAASGTSVTSSSPNLRFDINRDGAINTGDINAVKAASGRRLP